MHSETRKESIELAEMVVVRGRVDDEVIDVDDDVGEAVDHGLDEPLEGRGALEKPHAGRDPFELPQAWQREGRELPGFGV